MAPLPSVLRPLNLCISCRRSPANKASVQNMCCIHTAACCPWLQVPLVLGTSSKQARAHGPRHHPWQTPQGSPHRSPAARAVGDWELSCCVGTLKRAEPSKKNKASCTGVDSLPCSQPHSWTVKRRCLECYCCLINHSYLDPPPGCPSALLPEQSKQHLGCQGDALAHRDSRRMRKRFGPPT